jgi:hypothetical protein
MPERHSLKRTATARPGPLLVLVRPLGGEERVMAKNAQLKRALDKIEALEQQVRALREELAVTDKLLEARDALIRAIPPCEAHGDQCVSHALEWVSKVKTLAKIIAA